MFVNLCLGPSNSIVVLSFDELIASDYLWSIALHAHKESIAKCAQLTLIELSYENLERKLKERAEVCHQRFFEKCFKKLEGVRQADGGRCLRRLLQMLRCYVEKVK